MTLTSTDTPTPRNSGPLPLPSAADVMTLQAVHGYPAVSVLCSTEPGAGMSRTDTARLKRLCDDATRRLDDEFGEPAARRLRDRLDQLAREVAARPTRAAVALYVSERHSSSWALPVPVADRTVIDPTFATRDLIRSLHRTPRHVVLVLTDREARLFDGVSNLLLPAVPSPFPLVVARPGRPGQRRRPVAAAGHVTEVDEEGDAFFRIVDRALGTYLSLRPAPLVLVGASRTVSRFTHLSRNLGRLAGTVYGSHARTPLPALVNLVRPLLDSYLQSRQGEALELLEQRAGAGRVVTGMPSVWLAARAERPEMLAVEQGLFYPARLSDDGDFLEPATDVNHPEVIDDAVDEVIEQVLRRGGWVALVEDGALAAQERIALTLRRR